MFGYVKPYQPELKVREAEAYNGIYCALCKSLGRRYGLTARLTLNYDFAFLAVIKMAVAKGPACFSRCHCLVHPLKKKNCCKGGTEIDFAADAAVLVTYYKLLDTLADEGMPKRIAAKCLLLFAKKWKTKAQRRLPALAAVLAEQMRRQADLEMQECRSVDEAAEPSAIMLAAMMATGETEESRRRVLERIGYCLGRWIYLLDAADDLADDLKNGRFNPYIQKFHLKSGEDDGIAKAKEYAECSLNASMAECAAALALLETEKLRGILENVLTVGLKNQQNRILHPEKEKTI